MLKGFQYISAGMYHRIYKRQPGGTAYYNLMVFWGFILFIHVMQFRLLIRIFWGIDIMNNANIYVFLLYYLLITAIAMLSMHYLAPLAKLKEIKIADRAAGKI